MLNSDMPVSVDSFTPRTESQAGGMSDYEKIAKLFQ